MTEERITPEQLETVRRLRDWRNLKAFFEDADALTALLVERDALLATVERCDTLQERLTTIRTVTVARLCQERDEATARAEQAEAREREMERQRNHFHERADRLQGAARNAADYLGEPGHSDGCDCSHCIVANSLRAALRDPTPDNDFDTLREVNLISTTGDCSTCNAPNPHICGHGELHRHGKPPFPDYHGPGLCCADSFHGPSPSGRCLAEGGESRA